MRKSEPSGRSPVEDNTLTVQREPLLRRPSSLTLGTIILLVSMVPDDMVEASNNHVGNEIPNVVWAW